MEEEEEDEDDEDDDDDEDELCCVPETAVPPVALRVDGREGSAGCCALPSEDCDDEEDPMPWSCVATLRLVVVES